VRKNRHRVKGGDPKASCVKSDQPPRRWWSTEKGRWETKVRGGRFIYSSCNWVCLFFDGGLTSIFDR